jgi:hypothetical protein
MRLSPAKYHKKIINLQTHARNTKTTEVNYPIRTQTKISINSPNRKNHFKTTPSPTPISAAPETQILSSW